MSDGYNFKCFIHKGKHRTLNRQYQWITRAKKPKASNSFSFFGVIQYFRMFYDYTCDPSGLNGRVTDSSAEDITIEVYGIFCGEKIKKYHTFTLSDFFKCVDGMSAK
jgi:hypothetical protein